MPSTRPIRLDEWGISWEEYKELSYFCLQYERKKREADALLTIRLSTPEPATYRRGGVEFGTFLPRGSGQTSDPVAQTAARRERLLSDVRMIDQAAQTAARIVDNPTVAPALIRAVTTRGGIRAVFAGPDRPACGERQFYRARRVFFWALREIKGST